MSAMKHDTPKLVRAESPELLAEIGLLACRIWREHYPSVITAEQIEYMLADRYEPVRMARDIDAKRLTYEALYLANATGRDELVGYMTYGPEEDPAVLFLHQLYLLPEKHGTGLGSFMLAALEERAKSRGKRSIRLRVNKRNGKAIKAYVRNAYYVEAEHVADIGAGYVMDDYILRKDLPT